MKKKGDYYVNPCLSKLKDELQCKKWPKHQNHLSQLEECVYSAQSWKERRLLCESMVISMERQTSILKIVEREIVLMKPKH